MDLWEDVRVSDLFVRLVNFYPLCGSTKQREYNLHCTTPTEPCPGEPCITINRYVSNSSFRTFYKQNSAVTGGGAVSTTAYALTISGASFSDNSARLGGDAIHACSYEVTVESSDGLLSGSANGQCFQYTNSGVSSYYEVNWPLFLFMIIFTFMLVYIKYCINCVGYTLGFIVYCCIVIVAYNDSDILMFNNT